MALGERGKERVGNRLAKVAGGGLDCLGSQVAKFSYRTPKVSVNRRLNVQVSWRNTAPSLKALLASTGVLNACTCSGTLLFRKTSMSPFICVISSLLL